MTEFEFERGELLSNLTLLEDHAQKFHCPYCEEKHLSKIIGYTDEIAMGKEGDEKELEELGNWAREWRRKLQGAKEHSHEHKSGNPHSLSKCEKKQKSCIEKVALKCCGGHVTDFSSCSCNPIAVCKTSVACK